MSTGLQQLRAGAAITGIVASSYLSPIQPPADQLGRYQFREGQYRVQYEAPYKQGLAQRPTTSQTK